MKKCLFVLSLLSIHLGVLAQTIQLNQVGYYPQSEKIALIEGGVSGSFYVVNTSNSDTAFTGNIGTSNYYDLSEENVSILDFSDLEAVGEYEVRAEGQNSYPFVIGEEAARSVLKGTIKSYYYNRCSAGDLLMDEEYAGDWARPGGHSDKSVYIHESAATDRRPQDFIFSFKRGWYDAGDYNKYIVNSGITTYTLLSLYERYSEMFDTLNLNIPESSNNIPDLLDEVLWNLRWMMTMQDPWDGGVYHKLTTLNFESDWVMPHQASQARYVVMKSSAATFDFAAVMAQAYRVFYGMDNVLPGLADSCITMAERAWNWGVENPNVRYSQPADVFTGTYGDSRLTDERNWAAAEMYLSTGNTSYYSQVNKSEDLDVPGWQNVRSLGYYSLALYNEGLTTPEDWVLSKVENGANVYLNNYESSPNRSAFGKDYWEFSWGSSAIAGNIGMMLMQEFDLSNDTSYLDAAQSCLDHVLGKNATDYSFVTGFGDNTPMNLHHRPSYNDGVVAPVPGLVVGGPNSWPRGSEEGVNYPGVSAKNYRDVYASYSTNENAINYIAPIAYLAAALEAHHHGIESKHLSFVQKDSGKPVGFNTNSEIKIGVYPNPARGKLYVNSELDIVQVSLRDAMGRNVLSGTTEELDISSLKEGLYILEVLTNKGVASEQVVIKN